MADQPVLPSAHAAYTLYSLSSGWKEIAVAFIADDWAGSIIANSVEPTRSWWRNRLFQRRAYLVVHLLELPVVWWLSDGGIVFMVFTLVLAAKLSVFVLGRQVSNVT